MLELITNDWRRRKICLECRAVQPRRRRPCDARILASAPGSAASDSLLHECS
jgi:hypothetical protein